MKPHLQTTIWTLLKGGATQREIERITSISRHTIRMYQRRFAADPANCPGVAIDPPSQTAPPWPPTSSPIAAPLATSKCEPHRAFIDAQLRLGRNATAIYQDLVDLHGFDGAYNSVKRFCAQLRHKEPEQFDRLSFAPGEEMQVDYGEGAPTRVPGTERWRKPRLFVATLRYSRRSFRRVVWKSGQQVWAELHEQAWRYFGGSTRYVVLDNLKEGVLKPDLYEPALNPVYAATLAHYEVVADPARVRDLRTQQLLRTHTRVDRPGTVVLPMAERVFNPSRETRFILAQARAIGPQASRLCQMLFAIEGRVGQRKLWGIVNLARRYPNHLVDSACAQAMEQGVHSYRHVKALTERLVTDALAALEAGTAPSASTLTQQHALIRSADEYGDLFAHATTQSVESQP